MSVLIIGGGPAGLALAGQLQERAIEYTLLERAPFLGSTFRCMAANTCLSPWINTVLPGTRPSWRIALRPTEREEYAQYLTEYAIQRNLSYLTSVEVDRVTREPGQFRVSTSRGQFQSRVLVNATGYFSNPHIPELPRDSQCEIPQIHAAAYQDPDTVRRLLGSNRGRVLVVGHRLTAGEIIEGLYRSGYEVCLSHRSPIRYALPDMLQACVSPFSYILEESLVHLPGMKPPLSLESRMPGGVARQLIEWGLVRSFPAVVRLERRAVVFQDGQDVPFDLVIYATGYRPALKHLAGLISTDPETGLPPLYGAESRETPGLFFLGLQGLRTFRSQFLRGIREDAVYLADWLANYWLLDRQAA
ncbi:hypothetical protein DYH09_11045 [bacterium CPR1]|nr:hypothetical protein [bacterium CPR1]